MCFRTSSDTTTVTDMTASGKRWKKTNNHVIHFVIKKKKKTWTWLLPTFRHVEVEYGLLAHGCYSVISHCVVTDWVDLSLASGLSCGCSALVLWASDLIGPPLNPETQQWSSPRGENPVRSKSTNTRSYYTALSSTKNNWPDADDQVRASMKASKWNVWCKIKKFASLGAQIPVFSPSSFCWTSI